jgi:2,3-dihydroxybenzoate decarboxylase
MTTPARRKLALEEHFITESFLPYLADTYQNINPDLAGRAVPRLLDLGEARLAAMDAAGLDYAVLSIAGPGVQVEPDAARATRLAAEVNDTLADAIGRHPTRFGGFAHLPMQDPAAAAAELTRAVTQLGMQGAMINGQSNGVYLDAPQYKGFWAQAASLNAPIYLHPGNPPAMPSTYAGHPALYGPFWGWAVETATHALRLVLAGVFDRHPGARLILGHMGETLPFLLWRFDSRLPVSHALSHPLVHPPSDYIRRNIALTTSGVCDNAALRCAIDAMGLSAVMFSVDHPFEDMVTACRWIDEAPLTPEERTAITHKNAEALLTNYPRS